MCQTVIVVKHVYQHGHICEVEACWHHWYFPLRILAPSQAPKNNKRLCVDKPNKPIMTDFKLITSSAREIFARPHKGECPACVRIEEAFASSWAEDRANIADRAKVVAGLENQLLGIRKQHKLAVEEGDQGAMHGLEKLGKHLVTEIQEAKGRLNKSVSEFEVKKANTDIEAVVNHLYAGMRRDTIASFDVRTNRRQFIAAFRADGGNFKDLVQGRFNESLIVTL